MKRQPLLVACTVAALAAAGCSGGGSQMTPAGNATTQSQSGKATLTITIPSKSSKTSTGSRIPQYVSPNTNSATFTVAGGTPQVVDLSPSSSACTPATGDNRTCTATITAPVGTGESLVIKTFANSTGTGDALTNNTESIDVTQDGPNNFSFTLNGVLSSIQLAVSPDTVTTTEAADLTASLTPLDASGATIIGNPVGPDGGDISGTPTLSASPATGFTIDPFNDTTDSFAVHYDGSSTTSPVTLTASVTGYPSADATVTVNGAPTPPPGISNGDFASGALTNSQGFGWTSCSIGHTSLTAAINPSPAPAGASMQTAAPTTPVVPPPTVTVGTPPPNYNPNVTPTAPPAEVGSNVALTGDPQGETAGSTGICQTFVVPTGTPELTFWVYEGGSEYNFRNADQEADILDSTGTTIQQTLFAEQNCFWNPGVLGDTGYLGSGCIPSAYGGTSSYADWQGGYWTERGPFDLSTYAGQTVTLFIGVWSAATHASPTTYGQFMFVGGVQLSAAGSGSVNVTGRSHR